jgi:sigma-B regulation protein RsbU (phosphoserine phosphatase)
VLAAVHEAMADHEPPTYCTAAFMVYTPEPDRAGGDLVLALGGHPPPVLRRADGGVGTIGRTGTLLGLIEPKLHDVHVRLQPGDTVLAYTDGLTDAPGGQAVDPHELLDGVATDDIEEIAAELRRRHGLRPGALTDDTALLLLHVETVPELDPASVPVSTVVAPTA